MTLFVEDALAYAKARPILDPAHDFSHSERVLVNAQKIQAKEGGDLEVLSIAAAFHDLGNLPKDHPEAKKSAYLSAEIARKYLSEKGWEDERIRLVEDCIVCHSFSLGEEPKSHEARVFQDADRLESLGAFGIARTFMIGGRIAEALFHPTDPWFETDRPLEDKRYTIDHYFKKVLKLESLFKTETGKEFARKRTEFIEQFLVQMRSEMENRIEH